MNYKNINDYEVLYLIEDDNDSYKGIMYNKYSPMIMALCNRYIHMYRDMAIDRDDLYQEAFIGMDYAISRFDFHKDVKFSTYCTMCVECRIKDYFTKLTRKKNLMFHNSLSLNEELGDFCLEDMISSNEDVYNKIAFKEDLTQIINFKNSLTVREAQVFELRFNGFTCKEIAILLNISLQYIYLQIRQIRQKYRNRFCL